MKRSSLTRRTPLRTRKRLRPKPWPRATLGDALVLMAHFGVSPRCERCGDNAQDLHHVKTRARGGSDELSNIKPVCRTCHRWIHANPEAAAAVGLLLHSWQDEAV